MDISFCNINLYENKDICDNIILKNTDFISVMSLNGRRYLFINKRCADKIIKLAENNNNYFLVLKIIRIWAKNKGIYSNMMGYLGGISWAILLLKVF